jgi:hypothetical protein
LRAGTDGWNTPLISPPSSTSLVVNCLTEWGCLSVGIHTSLVPLAQRGVRPSLFHFCPHWPWLLDWSVEAFSRQFSPHACNLIAVQEVLKMC